MSETKQTADHIALIKDVVCTQHMISADRRERIATTVLAGIRAAGGGGLPHEVAKLACFDADALIAELDK